MKRAVLYLILVFLSGLVAGVVGSGMYHARVVRAQRPPDRNEMLRRYREDLRARLNLTPDQVSKLDAVLEATRVRFRDLREKYGPEVRAIRDQQNDQIRALLDDRQKAEYDRMREERERQHQQDQQRRGH